jgi:hypothetical protein
MGTVGRFSLSGWKRAPSSNETKTPVSVPAYRRPLRFGSSRTARTKLPAGMPLCAIRFQL